MVSYKSIQRGDAVMISSSKMLNSVNTFFVNAAKIPQATLRESTTRNDYFLYKKTRSIFLFMLIQRINGNRLK